MVTLRIASFDIGKKNFAFFVDDVNYKKVKSLREKYRTLPKKNQRRVKGPMNRDVEKMLNSLFKSSTRVEMGVFDITGGETELNVKVRLNLFELLEKYADLWMSCHVILIEQQYFNIANGRKSKPTGANVDAIKIAECCISWFLFNYSTFKDIRYFGSMYKTHVLGAPEKLTKPQRKKWSIQKAKEILELRGDTEAISLMNGYKNAKGKKQKLDDVSDCLLQIYAFVFLKLIVE